MLPTGPRGRHLSRIRVPWGPSTRSLNSRCPGSEDSSSRRSWALWEPSQEPRGPGFEASMYLAPGRQGEPFILVKWSSTFGSGRPPGSLFAKDSTFGSGRGGGSPQMRLYLRARPRGWVPLHVGAPSGAFPYLRGRAPEGGPAHEQVLICENPYIRGSLYLWILILEEPNIRGSIY